MYLLICIFNSRCTFGSSDHFCSLPIELPRQLGTTAVVGTFTLHACFSINQEIMSNYTLLACTWLGVEPPHSHATHCRGRRRRHEDHRCECDANIYSEEECSIGTATRFAWSVIKRSIAGEPSALKQDSSAAADIKAAVDAGVQYIKTCFSADQCLQTAVTIIGIEPGNLLLYSPPNFF